MAGNIKPGDLCDTGLLMVGLAALINATVDGMGYNERRMSGSAHREVATALMERAFSMHVNKSPGGLPMQIARCNHA